LFKNSSTCKLESKYEARICKLKSEAFKEARNRFPACTVTRPYEGFRHPDWMAPESTVRGRENDFLVRPGYIHPQIPSFSGGYGIFRRFTLRKNDVMTQ
jgi:hypothetical protein